MPSHLSTIGFEISTPEEFGALAQQIAGAAEALTCSAGEYLRWSGRSGEQLWLQFDRDGNIVGMTPHFAGMASLRVGLQSRIHRESDTTLDGAFYAWADPQDSSADSGICPVIFDAPDARLHEDLQLPVITTVQIAAFAHEVALYTSLAEYEASQAGREVRFASQSFIPAGMFSAHGDATDAPASHAIFTGHVIESARMVNALTGRVFHWALVESLGGSYDVVIDPSLSPHLPRAGGILSGSFWLSGRLRSLKD